MDSDNLTLMPGHTIMSSGPCERPAESELSNLWKEHVPKNGHHDRKESFPGSPR